jgi:hypothetical protein
MLFFWTRLRTTWRTAVDHSLRNTGLTVFKFFSLMEQTCQHKNQLVQEEDKVLKGFCLYIFYMSMFFECSKVFAWWWRMLIRTDRPMQALHGINPPWGSDVSIFPSVYVYLFVFHVRNYPTDFSEVWHWAVHTGNHQEGFSSLCVKLRLKLTNLSNHQHR